MFKLNGWLVLMLAVLQFSSCSIFQPVVSGDSTSRNILNSGSTPENTPKTFADENFEKDWKKQYAATSGELKRNQRLWQESKISDYDYVIAKYAGGNTNEWNRLPVLIKIRNDAKISIEKVEKDKDYVIYSRTDGFEDFDAIDKLFNFIEQELDGGKIFQVEYDKKFGYPRKVFEILHYKHMHNYRGIEISKFEIVK